MGLYARKGLIRTGGCPILLAAMEFLLFILASILVGRVLEKTKYRVAVVAHAILFVILMVVCFFGSNNFVVANIASGLVGEEPYEALHYAFSKAIIGTKIGYSSLAIAEICIALSFLLLAMRSFLIARGKALSLIKMKKGRAFPSIKEDKGFMAIDSLANKPNVYLVYGHMRN